MSKFLTQNQINSFDTRVKTAYEHGARLRGSVEIATDVVGHTHRFPRMGKGLATRRTSQTDVIPMNITHAKETANLVDWNAPEYTDIFDKQKVNYSEQDRLAGIIAKAIGRREDQMVLDALDAAASTLQVDTNVGGANTGLNTAKLRRARKLLNAQGVDSERGMRATLCSADGMEALLGDSDANTFDKNVVKALFDGDINRWLGFDFTEFEERVEGGLPKAGAIRTQFQYHKTAIGLAVGMDFRSEVNYIPTKTSWLANGLFTAGATHIDALGIVEMETTEA